MSTSRVKRIRHALPVISPTYWAMMTDGPMPTDFDKWQHFGGVKGELWCTFRDAVICEWIRDRPGSRPSSWWRFDAPLWPEDQHGWHGWYFSAHLRLPRARLGGRGTALHDIGALVPEFEFGIPSTGWGADFDVNDPPLFESEASYLRRLNLFVPGEQKRLQKADFEPEPVPIRENLEIYNVDEII